MRETLHGASGLDETRIRRAFGWVVAFRDFPVGSWQVIGGDAMMTEALTLFTKGRAEFYLDDTRRGDRVPGILSSEHDLVGLDGTFTLKYVEPTTRVCIPSQFNRDRLPKVEKIMLDAGSSASVIGRHLVCLGSVSISDRVIREEQTFHAVEPRTCQADAPAILLRFLD